MKREDGRSPDQLRRLSITRKYLKYAQGSCLIEMGNTKVICAASVERNVPYFLRNSGQGWLTAEYRMLPCATDQRVPRDKVSGRTMEIQRLIGRSLRSVIDMKRIGERTIRVDCDVVQANGGTRTTAIVGSFIALVDCLVRLFKRNEINELCITDYLAATSVGLWQGTELLDLTYLEDSQADVDMNVVMKGAGEFIEIQGTAEKGSFSEVQLAAFLQLAKKGIAEILEVEREMFKDVLLGL